MNRFLSATLLATVSFLISCNDDIKEPDYPIEPYIESAEVKFVDVEGTYVDSLKLSFYFRDGDMDLGLDWSIRSDSDYPYHPINYFLENNGGLSVISTKHVGRYPFLNIASDQQGKLVTLRTQKKDGYDFLPEFGCANYTYDSVFVLATNKEIFDETYSLLRTLDNPEGYHLLDTFYNEMNPNFYNITIDFLVKQPDASFVEFDWSKEFCTTFNGRFPLLKGIKKGMTVVAGPFKIKAYSTKDGELRYLMRSFGFKTLFGGKTIKLRIKIKDRALHDSNIIESNEIDIP